MGNPWEEFLNEGLTREDQIEAYKDWLAIRQSRLDQVQKRFDDDYSSRRPSYNKTFLEEIDAAKFRLEIDRWSLEQFIEGLDDDDSQEIQGI